MLKSIVILRLPLTPHLTRMTKILIKMPEMTLTIMIRHPRTDLSTSALSLLTSVFTKDRRESTILSKPQSIQSLTDIFTTMKSTQ